MTFEQAQQRSNRLSEATLRIERAEREVRHLTEKDMRLELTHSTLVLLREDTEAMEQVLRSVRREMREVAEQLTAAQGEVRAAWQSHREVMKEVA
jgi:hypothetical protein